MAENYMERTKHTCCHKQKVKRGLWSQDEDEKLVRYVTTYGHGSWAQVPRLAGLKRCGKSCRLRWINYLRPDLKKGSLSNLEIAIILELQKFVGNRWALIAKQLPGRTDNEIKNFWNSIKNKIIFHHRFLASLPRTKFPGKKSIPIRPCQLVCPRKPSMLIPSFNQMNLTNPFHYPLPIGATLDQIMTMKTMLDQMPQPSIVLPPSNDFGSNGYHTFTYKPHPVMDPNQFVQDFGQQNNFMSGFNNTNSVFQTPTTTFLGNSQVQGYGQDYSMGFNENAFGATTNEKFIDQNYSMGFNKTAFGVNTNEKLFDQNVSKGFNETAYGVNTNENVIDQNFSKGFNEIAFGVNTNENVIDQNFSKGFTETAFGVTTNENVIGQNQSMCFNETAFGVTTNENFLEPIDGFSCFEPTFNNIENNNIKNNDVFDDIEALLASYDLEDLSATNADVNAAAADVASSTYSPEFTPENIDDWLVDPSEVPDPSWVHEASDV